MPPLLLTALGAILAILLLAIFLLCCVLLWERWPWRR